MHGVLLRRGVRHASSNTGGERGLRGLGASRVRRCARKTHAPSPRSKGEVAFAFAFAVAVEVEVEVEVEVAVAVAVAAVRRPAPRRMSRA
jgi:hypothetical protein